MTLCIGAERAIVLLHYNVVIETKTRKQKGEEFNFERKAVYQKMPYPTRGESITETGAGI